MSGCASCPAARAVRAGGHRGRGAVGGAVGGAQRLMRLGLSVPSGHRTVALVGTPNTGKTTLFNALTGLRQHTGNWPGTTVTRTAGGYLYAGKGYRVLDLPGTYSLDSASPDEEVTRDALFIGAPDVAVVVTDSTRLARGLPLVLQVQEVALRTVIALNLIDEADQAGISIDVRHLQRELGTQVVPISARQGRGLVDLMRAVATAADGPPADRSASYLTDPDLLAAIRGLAARLRLEFGDLVHAEWVARKLLEGDPVVQQAVLDGTVATSTVDQVSQMDDPSPDPARPRTGPAVGEATVPRLRSTG